MTLREKCEKAASEILDLPLTEPRAEKIADAIERVAKAAMELAVRAALRARPQMTYKPPTPRHSATFGGESALTGIDRGTIEVAMYDDDASVAAAVVAAERGAWSPGS